MTASAGPALKELHEEFSDRIAFITLYVREAHPGDNYPQPKTFERKVAHARDYRNRDEITWPIAVDDINGSLHRRLDPKPHAAYIMGDDGKVLWRTMWANVPEVLRQGLEASATHQLPPKRERQPRVRPMLAGTGIMWKILNLSGGHAKTDVAKEAPPMLLAARLAWLMRPLPLRIRGALAMAVSIAPMVAALALGARKVRRRVTQ